MSDEREPPCPDTTARGSEASFDEWLFETGLPDGDALQRMCREAASLAVADFIKDAWLHVSFSDGRNAPPPVRLEFGVHVWDGAITLARPFAEVMQEMVQDHGYIDGELDDDDPDVLEVIRELEAVIAMIKSRMRPRESKPDV